VTPTTTTKELINNHPLKTTVKTHGKELLFFSFPPEAFWSPRTALLELYQGVAAKKEKNQTRVLE
jgi:hypothetical protein